MVYAGEDPRYIFRRMVILAGEDIGMADPNAVVVVTGCATAFDRVGMPEGRYPLAQAALYLATAPKSNSVMAFFDALATVKDEREGEVPNAMRDATRDKKGFGHGADYLYPHAYRDHWVAQQYLPGSLQGQVFYQPSNQGYEAGIQTQVARRREAQLAALVARGSADEEALTFGPENLQQDKWLERATGALGEQLGAVRDRLFQTLNPQRHHVLLDLNATTGLLTWEAIRQVPEGGAYACVHSDKDYEALVEQAAMLSELARPVVVKVKEANWSAAIKQTDESVLFDGVVGRNALMKIEKKATAIKRIQKLIAPKGKVALAESIPSRGQRLSQLLDPQRMDAKLLRQLAEAEAPLYKDPQNSMVNWDASDLQQGFEQAGFECSLEIVEFDSELTITPALLQRWLGEGSQYCDRLTQHGLTSTDVNSIRLIFSQQLSNQNVIWTRSIAFIEASLPSV